MDDHEGPAVAHLHRQRSLYAVERAHRSRRVELFGSVLSWPVRGNPPGTGVVGERKLRQLIRDLEGCQPGLGGKLVPEADAVVERAHSDREPAVRRGGLHHVDRQFVVVIAHASHFAPRLRPPFIVRLARGVRDTQPVAQRNGSAELKAEQRRKDQRAPIALEAVVEPSLVDRDRDFVATIRRSDHALASKWADRRRKRDGSKAAYDEPRWSSHAAIVRSGARTGHRQRGDALFQRRTIDSTSTP